MSTVQLKDRMLRVGELAEKLGVTTRHIHNLVQWGKMPAPLRLGGAVRWSESHIDKWIERGCPVVGNGSDVSDRGPE